MSDDVYQDALDEWGEALQIDQTIEELAELTAELARYQSGHQNTDDIAEELADVEIMCKQLRLCEDINRVDWHKDRKLDRLRDRLDA